METARNENKIVLNKGIINDYHLMYMKSSPFHFHFHSHFLYCIDFPISLSQFLALSNPFEKL